MVVLILKLLLQLSVYEATRIILIIQCKKYIKTNAAFSSYLINFQLSIPKVVALILVFLLKFSTLQVIIGNLDAGGAGDFDGDQGRVLPPRGQDSEAVHQRIVEKLAFLKTYLILTFFFTEFQWEQKIVMRHLRSLTIFDPG